MNLTEFVIVFTEMIYGMICELPKTIIDSLSNPTIRILWIIAIIVLAFDYLLIKIEKMFKEIN